MANVRKYGYMRPVKRIYNPIRWTPKRKNRNREYTTRHEEVMAEKREERQIREMEAMKHGGGKA